ncbi:MAG TPA: hypothetical protein PKD95_04285 [Candidatus Paceibacterota bacterium]|nr:hypothetical protein [Candidatus Paceibacterota bacterium]
MYNFLRNFVLINCLFLVPNLVLAYNPTINTTILPFDVVTIDGNIESEAQYLGKLIGYPQMYEFVLTEAATLTLELAQLSDENPIPFSLIIVKENSNNGGVSEVGRLQAKDISWSMVKDRVLGLKLLKSEVFVAELTAGVYRVEVSTPDNFGSYLLEVGDEPFNPGYFSTLSDIRTIQKFFDLSFFSLLRSSYVSYPLGIVILLILFYFTWRKREELERRFSLGK